MHLMNNLAVRNGPLSPTRGHHNVDARLFDFKTNQMSLRLMRSKCVNHASEVEVLAIKRRPCDTIKISMNVLRKNII